jgi:site-specific DNA-adenine methylase
LLTNKEMCAAYHGGKQRIGLEIAENIHLISTILENQGYFKIKGYCEPFCGMLGVYRHIPQLFEDHKPKLKYKAGDANESVIKMWQRAQKGWKPPTECTEREYNKLCNSNESSAKKGFICHQFSFGGQFCMGFSKKYDKTKDGTQASERVQDIARELKNVKFSSGSYLQFYKLEGYVIYCDPPYQDAACRYTDKKGQKRNFDNDEFWEWVRLMSTNNIVLVSEYSAPDDFIKLFEKKHSVTVAGKDVTGRESLFMYNPN